MAQVTIVKALAGYFNTGDGKRPLSKFTEEIQALNDDEKLELANGVCAITGDELILKK